MALPKLNDKPKYELTIPSSGKNVRYRPYLVREEKVLMIALESQDKKQALNAIVDTIISCVDDEINRKDLSIFDIEYMFLKIRSKSIGETSTVGIKCTHCNHTNEVNVNLEEIEVVNNPKDSLINIDSNIDVKMKYPNFHDILDLENDTSSETEKTFKLIVKCMDTIITEDEKFRVKDEPESEVISFIESLSSAQFNAIRSFIESMPRVQKDVDFVCDECRQENKLMLKGIDDFF